MIAEIVKPDYTAPISINIDIGVSKTIEFPSMF